MPLKRALLAIFSLWLIFIAGIGYIYFYTDWLKIQKTYTPVESRDTFITECTNPVDVQPVMVAIHNYERRGHASGVWIKTHLGDNYFATNAHVVLDETYQESFVVTTDPATIKKATNDAVFTLHHKDSDTYVKAEVVSIVNAFERSISYSQNSLYLHYKTFADVAILKVDNLPADFTQHLTQHPLAMLGDEPPTEIQSSGYVPIGNDMMAKYDRCRNIMYDDDSISMLDETETARKGMSGSGHFNSKGEIVGLLSLAGKFVDNGELKEATVSHVEDGILYRSYNHIHPGTLKIYTTATPAKWLHHAVYLIEQER